MFLFSTAANSLLCLGVRHLLYAHYFCLHYPVHTHILPAPPGGCGSMYKVSVESPMFEGKSLVKQHRMVTEVLRSEISEMHAITIDTKVSP